MRLVIVRWFIYFGLLVLLGGLFNTQVNKGERFKELSDRNRVRLIPMEAPRGRVFDRKGKLLATNRPSYEVVAMPEDITPEAIKELSEILDLSEAEIKKRLKAPREYRFTPSLIQKDISRELAFHIEERRPELPGVSINVSFLRYYPYEETASHVIGYIGKINREEYERLDHSRFGMTSLIGRSGIERIFDDQLRGWRGGRQLEVNARGHLIRTLSEKIPIPGEDITVTLDLDFQQKIMEIIAEHKASVMVLDLKNDDIIAIASNPAYNPNAFVEPGRGKERIGFLTNKDAPLIDRGVSGAYPPGSIFKLVTAIAGLETGKITPKTRYYCNGKFQLNSKSRAFKCWYSAGHGHIDIYEALERSCNVYFYNLGAKLSPDDIAKYAHMFGLGEPLRFETSQAVPGLVPDKAWKKKRFKDSKWYQGETLSYAIGQSYLLTSPVQILRLTGIIAKDGIMVEPHILVRDENKKIESKHIAARTENIKVVKRAMLKVVESDFGTGQLARVDFTKLAAKTGTAQVPPNQSHSWMTGFFPYKDPEMAFVVFVEHGGSGGVTGANIVKNMLEAWKEINVQSVH